MEHSHSHHVSGGASRKHQHQDHGQSVLPESAMWPRVASWPQKSGQHPLTLATWLARCPLLRSKSRYARKELFKNTLLRNDAKSLW